MKVKKSCVYLSYLMKEMEDYEYLLSVISHHCGPALEGVKVSSLLNIRNTGKRCLIDTWQERKDEILDFFKIDAFTLKKEENSEVVLLFRRETLENHLKDSFHLDFLKRFGYREEWDCSEFLLHLKNRFTDCCPHEIGVFLGYTLCDVIDFMSCPNKECRLVGYWKVYNDEIAARELFRRFDEAKAISTGKTLRRIAQQRRTIRLGSNIKQS
ncbi:MAG: DUF3793 family protein [Filifactor alocis]|nr:DUF3793 family protein [Filifactor alocis]